MVNILKTLSSFFRSAFIFLCFLTISKADMNIPQTHVFNFSEDYSSPFFEESGLGMAVEQNLMEDESGFQCFGL